MSPITALVVDDNTQNLKVLTQLLIKNGARCVEVANPTKLETLLPTLGPVDVVFLDLEMPGLDGFQAKDLLRVYLSSTPIIAYTVHANEIDVVRRAGFDGFLGKPLDGARFPEILARILRGEAVWERS